MLDTLAHAGLYGFDPEKMINGTALEFGVRARAIRRASELRADMDDRLAVAIINRLAEATKGNS